MTFLDPKNWVMIFVSPSLVFVCFLLLGEGVACFSLTHYIYYLTLSHLASASDVTETLSSRLLMVFM